MAGIQMVKRLRRHVLGTLVAGAMLITSAPALAAPEDEPTAGEMAADLIVARPIGILATVAGSVAFVASLPFSALGGNVGEAADALVVGPAKAAFVRCLGCKSSGRYVSPDAD